ncbi:MAG TPA: DUF4214 domain-containing protein [Telluria sp.]|nr:DUF4214 domain-containing protein [Telluria sp.]
MNTSFKPAAALLCAALLTACGGGDQMTAMQPAPVRTAAMSGSSAQQLTAAAYYDMIQHIYVAYFGRPADPAGLDFFANGYLGAGASTNIRGVAESYAANPAVAALVDVFANSAESAALYPGANEVFINAIYRNLFNRDADPGGLSFWANAINSGAMTRANAAISIMAGAVDADATIINKKTQVAGAFTAAVNTDQRKTAYSGLDANAAVRTMLATVNANTDVAAFGTTIEATLNQLAGGSGGGTDYYAPVAPIIVNRCVGCHSATPTIAGYTSAPLGITFDTSAEIHSRASQIYNAVVSRSMPFGNRTGMTDAERQTVATWFEHGAP